MKACNASRPVPENPRSRYAYRGDKTAPTRSPAKALAAGRGLLPLSGICMHRDKKTADYTSAARAMGFALEINPYRQTIRTALAIAAAVTVFSPFFTSFGSALRIVFKVPPAMLATFTTCF